MTEHPTAASALRHGLLVAVLALACVAFVGTGLAVAGSNAGGDAVDVRPSLQTGQPALDGTAVQADVSRPVDSRQRGPAEAGVASADLQLASVSHPESVDVESDLEVGYTVENAGGAEGTEPFVDLNVDGTLRDWDENVTVPPGGTESGTLVYESVGVEHDPGETLSFSVALAETGDTHSGTATVTGDGQSDLANLEIASLEYPNTVEIDGSLEVGYTIENTGGAEGTEAFVDLKVAGSGAEFDDTDENVTVPAGDTASGTLAFDDIADSFNPGVVLEFSVELWEFGDSASGEVTVGDSNDLPSGADLQVKSIDYPDAIGVEENLTVSYTVENVGTETGTDSFVTLAVNESQGDWDADVTVPPGETRNGTLVYSGVSERYEPGDVITFGVVLVDSQTGLQGATTVQETTEQPSEPDILLSSISPPNTVPLDGALEVGYTLENVGTAQGTESAVELLVDGTNQTVDDVDSEVTVPAESVENGTLSFDDVATAFDDGDTVSFTVQLADAGDTESATATVQGSDEPALQLGSIDPPASVTPNGSLDVGYTVENIGDAEGSATLELRVDGSGQQPDDTDAGVTVPAEGSTNGTLTLADVGDSFAAGDTITATVELTETGESASSTVDVENDTGGEANVALASVSAPDNVSVDGSLVVEYTLENTGDAAGFESFVDLAVEGTGSGLDDTVADVSVPAGETVSGTLTLENVSAHFAEGDTISFSVQLFDAGETASGQTVVEGSQKDPGDGGGDLQLAGLDAPAVVSPESDLEVEYTIENVGDQPATEGVVDLRIDGEIVDSAFDVTVQPGETENGTLVFTGVGSFEPGETISFSVDLGTAGDIAGGETEVGEPNATGAVELQGPVETGANVVGVTVTALNTTTGGLLAVENTDTLTPPATFEVTAGEELLVAVADIGGIEAGDTIEARLAADSEFVDVLDTDNLTVSPGGEPPVANFQTTPAVPEVGETVTLDASGSAAPGDDIVEYRWNLTGDGEADIVETDPVAEYTFTEPGTKPVTLTVENSVGQTATRSGEVVVAPEPEPPQANLSALDVAGQGETATVAADASADASVVLANTGGEAGTFEVTFTIGDAVTETRVVEDIEDGTVVTVEDVTAPLPVGTYGVTVTAGSDVLSGVVTVEETGAPEFAVDITGTAEATAGDDLAVTVTVQNTGAAEGTETVTLDAPGLGSATTTVTLAAGASTTETLRLETDDDEAGDYELSVSGGGGSDTGSVTVAAATEFAVSVSDTNSPVEPGEEIAVTVAVDNTGESAATQEVALSAEGMGNDAVSVSLDGGESATETLALSTGPNETGEYEVTVTSESDSTSTVVTVAESDGSGLLSRLLVLLFVVLVLVGGAAGFYIYQERQGSSGGDGIDQL